MEKQNRDESGGEEMAQQLRVVTTFPEDSGLVPSTYMKAHNHL